MTKLPSIDNSYLLDTLTSLLNTPSPTGYAQRAIDLTEAALQPFPGLKLSRTRIRTSRTGWTFTRNMARTARRSGALAAM
jgi:hypothetical protein